MSLARNIDLLRRLQKLEGLRLGEPLRVPGRASPVREITEFGSNPGDLRMFSFVPEELQQPRAMVVVLHGCGQTAAGYDLGAGWSTLARHFGFALLMPEQKRTNNTNTCFNWFNPEDIARESGEALSIRQMIARMVDKYGIDSRRIFITGLSAGGAMTSVMLSTYPEVFAAGAVIAGMPYGVASNLRQALDGMFNSTERPSQELGELVRNASDHRGPWPRVSVWQGSADRTVHPANATQIVKQWLDVHGLPLAPMAETVVDGHPRQAWWNADGETIVEIFEIANMAHGTPLGTADNDHYYGIEGAFLIEAGISSSYHISKFFGLTDWICSPPLETKASVKPMPARSPAPHLARSITAALSEKPAKHARPKRKKSEGIDIGAVITRALTAAGLMK